MISSAKYRGSVLDSSYSPFTVTFLGMASEAAMMDPVEVPAIKSKMSFMASLPS